MTSASLRRRIVIGALAVLVIAAGGLAAFLATRTAPADIRPHVAADGTYTVGSFPSSQGTDALRAAAHALPFALSYDYKKLDGGLADASFLMTDEFAREFTETFNKTARPMANDKHAVTDALVRGAGLVRLSDADAVCLVYIDQMLVSSTTTAAASAPVRVSQNRVIVELHREGEAWKVDAIKPF
jgi:Mce-associated membrane protein